MTVSRLNAEQCRALSLLATAGRDGTTQPLLVAHGFDVAMIADLVNQGFCDPDAFEGPGRRQDDRGRSDQDQGRGPEGARRRSAMTIARLPKSLMLEAYRMPADAPL